MSVVWLLLAQTKAMPPRPPPVLQTSTFWATLIVAAAFLGAIVLGLIVISLLGRWRKQAAPVVFDPNEQLAQFQQLYEKGELSQEEFDRIRERLARQLRPEHDSPAPVPAPSLKAEPPAKDGPVAVPPDQSPPGAAANPGDSTGTMA